MAGVKETPRQRMISMMYLVLTALLALNVSKEVIDAFIVVNESIEQTNELFSQRLDNTYNTFETMYQLNQTEVLPFWDRAKKAKSLSKDLVEYINNLRNDLISTTEGIPIDSAKVAVVRKLNKKDNFSITTKYFMGDTHDGSDGMARVLKNKIIEYQNRMMNLVDLEDQEKLKFGLTTDSIYYNADGKRQNWEAHNFYHTILAADITILNKLITDVYDTEFKVVNVLMDEINAEDFSYDKIDAKVLPNSNYVFLGDEYTAEVIVVAYDTSQSPDVYIMRDVDSLALSQMDQAELLNNKDGKTQIRFPAITEGINKYAGVVSVKNAAGKTNLYPFSNEYIVAQPSVTVSVEEMNVLYIGVDNTVSISASGIPKDNLVPNISNGTIKPEEFGDKWIVNILPGSRTAVITVMLELNGSMREMGSQRFRIKQLPDPIVTIANKQEGFINREILLAAGTLIPRMPMDFGFEFFFEIESFKMIIQRGFNTYSYISNSGQLTDEMVEQIEITNRGQIILFESIVAIGPYGDKRLISPIILTIN